MGAPRCTITATPPTDVSVLSGTFPLAYSATARFHAQVTDSTGSSITDLTFQWQLVPMSGDGTLLTNSDPLNGKTATLQHIFPLAIGVDGFIGGRVGMRALGRYCGQFLNNDGPDGMPNKQVLLKP